MTQSNTPTAVQQQSPSQGGTGLPCPLVLDFSAMAMDDDQLARFCADNSELRIELTADRELIVLPPAFPISGMKNSSISGELYIWAKQDGTGVCFDSSTGFTFANGAMRSPDASWISRERWESVPDEDKLPFSHIASDFVVELRSHSDSVRSLRDKMAEYIANAVRPGWLISPLHGSVPVYRAGALAEVLEKPDSVSGDPLLPGFTLDLKDIW